MGKFQQTNLNLGFTQLNPTVGSLVSNANKIIEYYKNNTHLNLLITNEMCISGYLPLDTIFNVNYQNQLKSALNTIVVSTKGYDTTLIVGDILVEDNFIYNVAYVIQNGKIIKTIKKQKLVNYNVFNEERYFTNGTNSSNNFITINGVNIAIVICEDLWHKSVVNEIKQFNPNLVISINASPYEKHKFNSRISVVQEATKILKTPIIYTNLVGAEDGIIFDGQSFVTNKNGEIILKLEAFFEQSAELTFNNNDIIINSSNNFNNKYSNNNPISKELCLNEEVYLAIQTGLLNFIEKNNFKGVIIGVSGGIDSAISATIAADTLGSDNVIAILMPSRYTSSLSLNIANSLVTNLGIKSYTIEIDKINNSYLSLLNPLIKELNENTVTEENLQSRIRGQILMAFANTLNNYIVLCNGNKSEIATGYFTLYGDSCGAFNLLKDLYKFEVYELAKWRNNNTSVLSKIKKNNLISKECLERAPTAELKPNQTDEDYLLPYEILDKILFDLIENNMSYSKLIAKFNKEYVNKTISLLRSSEFKRQQAPIGIKISNKSFGKEWRFPITNKFRDYL